MHRSKSISTILFLLLIALINTSVDAKCNNSNYIESEIKSAKIYKTGEELLDPIIELGSNETITLSFDDLSESITNYSYSIVHCTKEWQESGLIYTEYMDGFEVNQVTDYSNSMGTTVMYTHYNIQVPNNEVKLKLSGNYKIRVFDTYNPEKIILEKRFMLVEYILPISIGLKQAIGAEQRLTSQQLSLKVDNKSIRVSNPFTELTPLVVQNNQPDNQVFGLKPVFVSSDELVYTSPENLIFDGINEYRSFDINSTRYASSSIVSINQIGGEFNVQLAPSESNRATKYTNIPDINGKYKVKLANSDNSDTEADYVWVYFTLPYFDQLQGKEVHVYGELTNWLCSNDNMMQYSYQRQLYELRLKLKQGYYNYRYVVRDPQTGQVDQTFFEGNHYETENSYQVFVYYKPIGQRYDRLIGYKSINSRN